MSSKKRKTIPIRYMTWEEIIEEHIPCYFWNFEFENDNIGFHRKNFIPGSDEMSRKFKKQYDCGVSDYHHSKPVDSSIIVVEKHNDDVPVMLINNHNHNNTTEIILSVKVNNTKFGAVKTDIKRLVEKYKAIHRKY
jgi:hypothetical protein